MPYKRDFTLKTGCQQMTPLDVVSESLASWKYIAYYFTCNIYPFFFNDTIEILASSSSILLR